MTPRFSPAFNRRAPCIWVTGWGRSATGLSFKTATTHSSVWWICMRSLSPRPSEAGWRQSHHSSAVPRLWHGSRPLFGVHPERGVSQRVCWLLNCVTPLNWLERMIQFKEKAVKQGDNVSVGLLDYPVLMAADILFMTPISYRLAKTRNSASSWSRHCAATHQCSLRQ